MKWFWLIATSLSSLLLLVTTPSLSSAQLLSPIEGRILEYIDSTTEEAIALLEQVVNINSGTMNQEGVREVGKVFRSELDALGFQTRWISMDRVDRAGHLIAERSGNRGKSLLLIGHLDTVFEKDSPFQRFERYGTIAKGPGVEDMKGGIVVILYALKALQVVGALEDTSITVFLTGDDSPVISASSTSDSPSMTVPSAAILAPGRTNTVSSSRSSLTGTASVTPLASTRSAVSGISLASSFSAPEACLTLRTSIQCPRSMTSMSVTSSQKNPSPRSRAKASRL